MSSVSQARPSPLVLALAEAVRGLWSRVWASSCSTTPTTR
jgi:hypothetical protein